MISGQLFTRDYLLEGINLDPAWYAIDESAFASFCNQLQILAADMASSACR